MRRSHDRRDLRSLGATWRAPYFDLASGLYVPQVVSWDPRPASSRPWRGPKGGPERAAHAVRRALTAV